MSWIHAVAVLSGALDALALLSALLWRAERVGLARMLAAAALSAAFFALKAMALLALLPHRSFFLWVLLGFAYVAGSLPATGLALLALARRRALSAPVRCGAALALLGLPAALWGSLVEPFRLQTEVVAVPLAGARAGEAALRIGVLADVQARAVGEFERGAVARLMALEPDLILIPGDLAQLWPRAQEDSEEEFRSLVAALEAPLGVWMVIGDTDEPEFLERALAGTRVRLLRNARAQLDWRDRRITLCGIDASPSPAARAAAAEFEALAGEGDVRILLAHDPGALGLLEPGTRVDLVVAGHTHGGQVRLPWIGPPITLSSLPRRAAAGGLHSIDGRRVYVSRGLGVERGWAPRLRWACPPEITLLALCERPHEPLSAAAGLRSPGAVPQGTQR